MSECTHPFPGMTSPWEDAHLFPEICSSTDESSHRIPQMSSSMNESAHLFTGMKSFLYEAAEEGNVDAINYLIKSTKLNIFQQFTGLGNSVLHIALSRGNLRFVERLLEEVNKDLIAGCECLRAKNSHGSSALHLAAFCGHHELLEKLIGLLQGDVEAGNILRLQNSEGNTCLHEAAKEGKYKVVEVLLNRDAGLTSISNRKGETALFIASERGYTQIVERLLRFMDSNSNMRRDDGQTPLHAAVLCGHAGVVKRLLQHSPGLAKERDRCRRTAMHTLVFSFPVPDFMGIYFTRRRLDFIDIAGLLLGEDNSLCYEEDNRKQTPLHMAVEWEKYELVRILLRYGRDCIEAVDKDDRKPLHLAVMNAERLTRTIDVVEFHQFKNMLFSLMSRESLNHRDNRGRTPLHIAVENNEKDAALYKSIQRVLCINGALLTPDILEETRRMELSPAKSRIKVENVSVNAVLIATVSFAAAFTLPGGLTQSEEKPKAVFINIDLFKLFVICDAFSFCTSIAAAIIVQYAGGDNEQDRTQLAFSMLLLLMALISLVVAFGAAVNLVVASSLITGIVWTLVCLVPITIHVVRGRSKVFIFIRQRYKIFVAVQVILAFIAGIFLITWDILNVFLFTGIFFNVAQGIKKLLKR